MTISILSLHTYPVKSCAGITHTKVAISQSGLFLDRQWVIVDGNGVFLTQRQHAKMALIQPALQKGDLTLRSEEHTSELQSLMRISYAVFCLKNKTKINI